MGPIQEIIERWWDAFEAGDLDRVQALLAEDISFRLPGAEFRGREQVRAVLESYRAAFPDLRHEYIDAVESGETFVGELRASGTHSGDFRTPTGDVPATGNTVTWESADYIKVRDGKIVSWRAYFDQVALLTQLGLMPEPESAPA
jgi:steroid delta-isomerase-like uncharacterized protein